MTKTTVEEATTTVDAAKDDVYPTVTPHGDLEKLFDNVYMIQGSFCNLPGVRIGRAMTIVKRDNALTLINAVRVKEETLRAIEALGTIQHVVRLGEQHGHDDAFYTNTYKASFWQVEGLGEKLPKGITSSSDIKTLTEDGERPIPDMKYISLPNATKSPEGVIWIPEKGGTLITCDFIMNIAQVSPFANVPAKMLLPIMGFTGECKCPPMWRMVNGTNHLEATEKFLAYDWDNLIPAHGSPKIGGAKELVEANLKALLKKEKTKTGGTTQD